MKTSSFVEFLPIIACLTFTAVSGIAAGVAGNYAAAVSPLIAVAGIGILLALGFIGLYLCSFPEIEYGLALVIAAILGGLLLISTGVFLCLPGLIVGYLWGAYFANLLDRRNTNGVLDGPGQDAAEK